MRGATRQAARPIARAGTARLGNSRGCRYEPTLRVCPAHAYANERVRIGRLEIGNASNASNALNVLQFVTICNEHVTKYHDRISMPIRQKEEDI